jgi:hypothetical protein
LQKKLTACNAFAKNPKPDNKESFSQPRCKPSRWLSGYVPMKHRKITSKHRKLNYAYSSLPNMTSLLLPTSA